MSIVGHVGSDEAPLRKFLVVQIVVEAREVLDLSCTSGIIGNAVEDDQRVVLANIVVGEILVVRIIEAWEAWVWEVLLIFTPGDALGIEEINNSRDILRNPQEVIVINTKGVTTNDRDIVW